MKFTIDLENKKILIHDSFTRKELDQLFSLLNIENMDEFVIDKHKESTITYPNQPINPYYPDWTIPTQPYITYTTGTGTLDIDVNNTNYTLTNTGQVLCNEDV